MSIAVWTDGKERVHRKHFKPDEVNTNGATAVTSETPSPPTTEDYEEVTEYFNEKDGFYYEVSGKASVDNFDKLSEEEKAVLQMARDNNYDNLGALKEEYGINK